MSLGTLLKSLPLKVLNQECESIQNQIKGVVFPLDVAVLNSKERGLIALSGLYPNKAFGCDFWHMQLPGTKRQESQLCFLANHIAKGLASLVYKCL